MNTSIYFSKFFLCDLNGQLCISAIFLFFLHYYTLYRLGKVDGDSTCPLLTLINSNIEKYCNLRK